MCLDLLAEKVFDTNITALRLPEFTERQEASVMRLKGRLGMWVNTIRKSLRLFKAPSGYTYIYLYLYIFIYTYMYIYMC